MHRLLFQHVVDNRVAGVRVKLGGVGLIAVKDVAGELNHHDLHPQAQAEIRDFIFPGIAGGFYHALDAPDAEAAGNDNALGGAQQGIGIRLYRGLPNAPRTG